MYVLILLSKAWPLLPWDLFLVLGQCVSVCCPLAGLLLTPEDNLELRVVVTQLFSLLRIALASSGLSCFSIQLGCFLTLWGIIMSTCRERLYCRPFLNITKP